MKNFLLIVFLFTALMVLTMCESKLNSIPNQLKLESLVPGGCNSYSEKDTKSASAQNDTVFTNIKGDTLDMYIGVNYICCAPFYLEQTNIRDTLIITITDQCDASKDNCYCRCMCYYDWHLSFIGLNSNLEYQIYIYDPRVGEKALFAEGTIVKD